MWAVVGVGMTARVYRAREREATAIPLEAVLRDGKVDILAAVQGRDYFDIRFQGDRLWVTAGKYVGVVPLTRTVVIHVEPKVPVENLVEILAAADGEVAEVAEHERWYSEIGEAPRSVAAAVATAFVGVLKRLELEGLPKEYEGKRERGSMPRGSIMFERSIYDAWARGRNYEAVYEYWELSADSRRNRRLRYACRLLLAQHRALRLARDVVRFLVDFEELLGRAGVALERAAPGEDVPRRKGDEGEYWYRAERLARLIERQRGVELPGEGSEVELPSLLVNLEAVFEAYTRGVLKRGLGDVVVCDGNDDGARALFDNQATPLAAPDVVICEKGGRARIVVEVKYKSKENRSDINQVLTYALCYRVECVVVLLPAEAMSERGLVEVGTVNGVEVYRYRVNLANGDLGEEEEELCGAVRGLLVRWAGREQE